MYRRNLTISQLIYLLLVIWRLQTEHGMRMPGEQAIFLLLPISHWYVFENKPASTAKTDNPTILAVQIKWKEKETNGDDIPTDVYALKNFNVIFAPGDKGIIEAGKAYDVALSFSGDFRPGTSGGNAGGGEDKPDEPNIKANVTVTVTPADWTPEPTEKPFE